MAIDSSAELNPVTKALFPDFPQVSAAQISFACGVVLVALDEHSERIGGTVAETERAGERIEHIIHRQADGVDVSPESDGEEIDLIIREVLSTEDFPRFRSGL